MMFSREKKNHPGTHQSSSNSSWFINHNSCHIRTSHTFQSPMGPQDCGHPVLVSVPHHLCYSPSSTTKCRRRCRADICVKLTTSFQHWHTSRMFVSVNLLVQHGCQTKCNCQCEPAQKPMVASEAQYVRICLIIMKKLPSVANNKATNLL